MNRVAITLLGAALTAAACTPTSQPATTTSSVVAAPGSTVQVVRNPSRSEITGTAPTTWQAIPGASISVDAAATALLTADLWASLACNGPGSKYVRLSLDGIPLASSPVGPAPVQSTTQVDAVATVVASSDLAAGAHTVTAEIRLDAGAACIATSSQWHLRAETSPT